MKPAILWDFETGKTMVWRGLDESDTTEKGMVRVCYTDTNDFFAKKRRCERLVPRSAIYTIDLEGGETLKIIHTGSEEGVINKVTEMRARREAELQEQIEALKVENAKLQRRLADASEGVQKEIANMRGLRPSTPDFGQQPLDPLAPRRPLFFEDA